VSGRFFFLGFTTWALLGHVWGQDDVLEPSSNLPSSCKSTLFKRIFALSQVKVN
jgi:hypothetical protein